MDDINASLLKTATRCLVKECGGVEHAAAFTRVAKTQLSDYTNPENKVFMPIDVLMDLERACGRPIVTQTLCAINQGAMILKQESSVIHSLSAAIASVMKDTADIIHAGAIAEEDGAVSAREKREIAGQVLEGISSLTALLKHLDKADRAAGRDAA